MRVLSFRSKNLDYIFHREYYDQIFYEKGRLRHKNYAEWEQDENLGGVFEDCIEALVEASKRNPQDYKHIELMNPNALNLQSFTLKVKYPGLLVGIGNPHGTPFKGDLKIGMSLDYTTGLPFISGSSVKGCLQNAWDRLTAEDGEQNVEGIEQFGIERYLEKLRSKKDLQKECRSSIFAGIIKTEKGEAPLPMKQRDVFYGAIVCPTLRGCLKKDFITPHEAIEKSPDILPMIAISPNSELKFFFSLKDTILSDGTCVTAEEKTRLFQGLLKDFGIGAKTNVGYGILTE